MSAKTYTLEVTAEELAALGAVGGLDNEASREAKNAITERLYGLVEKTKAERERDQLRLPWKVPEVTAQQHGAVLNADGVCVSFCGTTRARRLASAAPELLEAVQAAREWMRQPGRSTRPRTSDVEALIERALRKVETGIPEDR